MKNTRECPCCPGLSWKVPENVGQWWDHVQNDEHEAMSRSEEGRRNINAFWAAKDAEKEAERIAAAGMLF